MNLFLSIPVELTASPIATMSPVVEEAVKGSVAGVAVLSFLFVISIFLLCVGTLILWLWSLVNVLSSKVKTSTEKLLWFLVILFLPFMGPILYLFIGRDKVNIKLHKKTK